METFEFSDQLSAYRRYVVCERCRPARNVFVDMYTKKYGDGTEIPVAANGYDPFNMIVQAVQNLLVAARRFRYGTAIADAISEYQGNSMGASLGDNLNMGTDHHRRFKISRAYDQEWRTCDHSSCKQG